MNVRLTSCQENGEFTLSKNRMENIWVASLEIANSFARTIKTRH